MTQATLVADPVCGMKIPAETAIIVVHEGQSYHFCEPVCAEIFRDDPDRWATDSFAGCGASKHDPGHVEHG